MDCQTCNDLLLDLAYGELDDVRAAAMRRHIDGCAECRAALARIERGRSIARRLTDEEVPGVSASVRHALAAALMAQPTASVATAGASLGAGDAFDGPVRTSSVVTGPTRWFERIGELAMKRQVAMAAVFLLMIGVGLIFYQSHPRPNDTTEDRRPDVVPSVEVNGNVGSGETSRRAAPPSVHPTERDDLRPRATHRAAASDEVRMAPAPSPAAAPPTPRTPNPAEFEALAADQNGSMPAAPAPPPAPSAPAPQQAAAGGDVAPPSVRAQAIAGTQQAGASGNAQGARLNANAQEAQTNPAPPPAHAAAAANNLSPPAVQASAPAANTNNDVPTLHNRVPSSLRHPMRHTGGRSRQPDDSQSMDMGL